MKENEVLLRKLEERLKKEFKYSKETNVISFYNQELEQDQRGWDIWNGYAISLSEVYRHNATQENKSCVMEIVYWVNNGGRRLARFKINCNWTDKRIEKEVLKALDEYNKLVKEEE